MALKRYFRFAVEGEYGGSPGDWTVYDFDSADITPPDDQYETFESSALRSSIYAAPGAYISEGSVSVPATLNGLEKIIEGALGGLEGGISTTLSTFHMAIGKEEFEHLFTGMAIDSLEMSYEDGFLVLSLDVVGGEDEKNPLPTVEATELPEEVFTALDGGFTISGADYTAKVEEMTLTIDNNIDVEETMPASQRFPTVITPQDLEVDLDLDITFENSDELERFWGGATGPEEGVQTSEVELDFVGDAGEFTVDIPRAICQTYESEVSGSEPIDQSLTYEALFDVDQDYTISFDIGEEENNEE